MNLALTYRGRERKGHQVTERKIKGFSSPSILKLLSSFNIFVKKLYHHENQQSHFVWYRERPLNPKDLRKEG